MAVKPTLVTLITNVIVKCREHAFAVQIALVDVVYARKLYQD